MRKLKFRVWYKPTKKFIDHCSVGNGIIQHDQQTFAVLENKKCIVQQFTGFLDKYKKEIYEGDIIDFKYETGDFAWEFLTKEETTRELELQNKTFRCQVIWSENQGSFILINGNPKSTHIEFPMVFASGSKVVGNIIENPELVNK